VLEVMEALQLLLRRLFAYGFTTWIHTPTDIDFERRMLATGILAKPTKFIDAAALVLPVMFSETGQFTIEPRHPAYKSMKTNSSARRSGKAIHGLDIAPPKKEKGGTRPHGKIGHLVADTTVSTPISHKNSISATEMLEPLSDSERGSFSLSFRSWGNSGEDLGLAHTCHSVSLC
jgi:hypothetical protein